ncbi:tetratricopeptide repeat protein [Marinobacter sp. VGCF2001]|uniref:tetratricopeptide repeat protein n=1 Tax=Marinobacter sp. VGCF2001 TaxID=3417189 RepID=UPI003CF7DAB5
MSLLNDALRAAEQRQAKPQVAPVYTGNPSGAHQSRAGKVALVVVLCLVFAVVAAGWFFLPDSSANKAQPEVTSAPDIESVSAAEQPPVAEAPVMTTSTEEPVSKPPMPASNPAPEAVLNTESPTQPRAGAVAQSGGEKDDPVAAPVTPERPAVPEKHAPAARNSGLPESETEGAGGPEPAATAPSSTVKQPRETPESIDLRSSRTLARLLAEGQSQEAEGLLASLTERQSAPNSREVVARELLVQGNADRALNWLPETVTNEYASLRLLRARALLELGQLDRALATLSGRVPAVAKHPEYRITLATLLQQAGKSEASAGHWAELIAYDDSRPAWWLGLAIALETGGRARSAIQAYAQAASLPGLSPALADYARERLNALQAGS